MAIINISQLTPAVEITSDAGMPSNVAGFFRVVKGNETAENAPTCENCSYFDFDDNWDSVHFACTHPIASNELDLLEMDWNTPACQYYKKE